jgi:FkbH-like protein
LYLSGCDRVGPGAKTLGRPLVHNEGRIEIGRDVTLRSNGSPVRLTATESGTILLGAGVVIDVGAQVFSERSVRIEDGVVIGPHVVICDRDEQGRAGEILIESGARIGANARVIGPCRVGRGAIVLAGALVGGEVRDPIVDLHASNGLRVVDSHGAGATNGVAPHAASKWMGPTRAMRAVVVADFTVDELAEHLAGAKPDGLDLDVEIGPFDQVAPTLMGLGSRAQKVDVAIAWTRPDAVSPHFRDLLLGGAPDRAQVFADVDAFAELVLANAEGARFVFVPSWVLPPWRRGLGMLELRGDKAGAMLMRMNLRLSEVLAKASNVFVLDSQRWLAAARDEGVDPKLWHAGKIAFTSDVLVEAAKDVRAALLGVSGMAKKLVVVDLDDTMWGGVVGDVGWENLRLGGHDGGGEAFVQFQRQLVALTKRGVALAVVSKNEEGTALDAMRKHPEMVVRPEMLAAYRINWRDKAQNIVEIVQELNLGLQSVVFIDDNPVERGRVSDALPEVYVPQWPQDPTHYPRALESLSCFDTPAISREDIERNEMFATERARVSLRKTASSADEWLSTLELVVRFEPLGASNVVRAAQLLNKTNQMNLRTRRMNESELSLWPATGEREVWTVSVRDRFGDAGLTGILGLARVGDDVAVEDFVLSCRVMARRVEETMLWAAKVRGAALGGRRLLVSPIVTAKNKPCLDFFAGAGLESAGAGAYVSALDRAVVPPLLVTVEGMT